MSLTYEVYILETVGWSCYCRHGIKHHKNAPASIWRHGPVEWYQYGVAHRLDGAARMGKFYIRGQLFTKEDYESKIRNQKN